MDGPGWQAGVGRWKVIGSACGGLESGYPLASGPGAPVQGRRCGDTGTAAIRTHIARLPVAEPAGGRTILELERRPPGACGSATERNGSTGSKVAGNVMQGPGVLSPRHSGVDVLAVSDCAVDFFGGDSSPRHRADAVARTGIAVTTNTRRSSSKCAENSRLQGRS